MGDPWSITAALPGWRFLPDAARGTVVLLHPSGLHTEMSEEAAHALTTEQAARVAHALLDAKRAGVRGGVMVQCRREPDGSTACVCWLL